MTQTVLLGDIGRVVTGKTPPKANPEFWGDEFDFITPTDFGDSKYVSPARKLSGIGEQAMQRLVCPKNSVIVTCIGSDMGKVALAKKPFVSNQQINTLIVDIEKADPEFVYYLLKFNRPVLRKYAESSGSTMPIINKSTFERLSFSIPDLETQKKIADILGTIDEKIELNRKMNETLEQMGQALFRHYFIDNSDASKWEEVKVSDLLEFAGGSQPPKSEHVYEEKVGYIRFVQNRDYSSTNHKTYIPIAKRNKLCNETDIMMDKYGEAGRVRFGIAGAYNVALAKIIPKHQNTQEYLRSYFSLSQIQTSLEGAAAASTRSSLNATTFAGLKVKMPTDDLLAQFEVDQKNTINQILLNKDQIQTLATLRDTLLPRLINGKVKV